MKTGIYWQDPKYTLGQYFTDPGCVLHLPLHRLDGASFISKDAYGHLCTVTGALWAPGGRYFDGTDDKINCTDIALPAGANHRTVIIWIKNHEPAGASGGCYLFKYGTFATPYGRAFGSYIPDTTASVYFGGYGDDFDSGIDLDDSDWHQLVYTYDGTDVRVFKDLIEGSNSPTAKTLNTVLDGHFYLGQGSGEDNMNATIGEVAVYNRVLTPLEIQHNYLAAKWRYQ